MSNHSESQEMTASKFKTCHWCGYNANLVTATSCEVCGRSLKQGRGFFSSRKSTANPKSFPRWLGIVLLAALVGGVAWIWKPWQGRTPSLPISTSRQNSSSGFTQTETMREVPNVPKGIFNYGGALTFAALTSNGMNDAIGQAHPDFRLRYTEAISGNPGSGTGISMLINGDLSFAQSARALEDGEYARAKERNVTLEQIPIGIDGLIFYTHPDLIIPGLSVEQLQNIFRGKLNNWKQVGGPDLPIVPVSLEPSSTSVLKQLLGIKGEEMGRNVKIVRDFTSSIRQVAATPGAISYASASVVIGQQTVQTIGLARAGSSQYIYPLQENGRINTAAFQDGSYPITRRLFVIIRRDGTPDQQAGIAYANLLLSREGQKIIDKAGFVPLR